MLKLINNQLKQYCIIYIFKFIWLYWVLVVVSRIFHLHCSMWDFFVVACELLAVACGV